MSDPHNFETEDNLVTDYNTLVPLRIYKVKHRHYDYAFYLIYAYSGENQILYCYDFINVNDAGNIVFRPTYLLHLRNIERMWDTHIDFVAKTPYYVKNKGSMEGRIIPKFIGFRNNEIDYGDITNRNTDAVSFTGSLLEEPDQGYSRSVNLNQVETLIPLTLLLTLYSTNYNGINLDPDTVIMLKDYLKHMRGGKKQRKRFYKKTKKGLLNATRRNTRRH